MMRDSLKQMEKDMPEIKELIWKILAEHRGEEKNE